MAVRRSANSGSDRPNEPSVGKDGHEGYRVLAGGDAASGTGQPPGHGSGDQVDSAGQGGEVESMDRLADQLQQANDRMLRLQAELDNLHKRSQRQLDEQRRYASMTLIRDLLSVADNVARAIQAAEDSGATGGLLDGVRLVGQQLDSVLAQHQCTKIDAFKQPFDPNLHEAIAQQPSSDDPPGTVIAVSQDGYRLYDRVVRPSQVIISTGAGEPVGGDGQPTDGQPTDGG